MKYMLLAENDKKWGMSMDIDFKVGHVIKKIRIEKKFSQTELSNDICHINSLVKIESNKMSPSFEILQALVGRLGVSIESIINHAMLEKNNFYMEQKALLEKCMENHDLVKLERYSDLIDDVTYQGLPIVEQQFLDVIRVAILLDIHHSKEKAFQLAKNSLYKTYKDGSAYFTKEENLLINLLLKIEQKKEHIDLAKQAYIFVSKQNTYLQDKHGYIMLTTGLMYTSYIKEDWFNVLEYATIGERLAHEIDKGRFLPNFIFMQGLATYLLETNIDQGLSDMKRALNMCRMIHQLDNYNDLLEHAKRFDIKL